MMFLTKMKEKQMQKRMNGVFCALLCTGLLAVSTNAWAADNVYGTADGKGTTVEADAVTTGGKLNLGLGSVYSYAYGGYDASEDGLGANKNEVTINNGVVIESEVYGGYSKNGNANENNITINGGYMDDCVYGGYSKNGNANENNITINGGYIDDYVYGGYSENGDSNYNQVIATGGFLDGDIAGGYSSGEGNSNGNKVYLSRVGVDDYVYGGRAYGSGNSDANEVIINHCSIYGDVYGGDSGQATANNNKVTITDSNIYLEVYGGSGVTEANGNKVTIINSTINDNVQGGIVTNGIANNNSVEIKNSLIKGDVFGGYIGESASADNLSAQNNTVVLDSAVVTGTIYGGYHKPGTASIKDNKLEVIGTKNAAENIKNFDTLNFFISKDMVNNDVMLTVKDTADIENATVKAGVELGSKLNAGDQITLIDAATLNADGINTGTLTDGLLQTEISITKDENKLVASIDSISHDREVNSTTPEAKSPVETQAAMLSVLNAGNNLLATAGFDSAASVVEDELYGSLHPFVISSANKMRVESGSHVDVKGWNLNIGLAKKLKNNSGELLIAPVIEYGRGSYDSYLDNGTHGEGDAHFWGAGLIAKQTNEDGLYYEGSLRLGKASTDYKSAIAGGISYDSDATYYAAHAGLGKIVTINDSDSLDYYGKLFYTRQQGDKVTVGNNATYDFDATTSLRSRIGARYTHKMDTKNAVYAGLAWQHEFDGEANAIVTTTLGSGSAPAPSVKGDTGIMELGWTANSDKLELGLGVNGSVGKQKGVGFTLKLDFKF